MGWTQFLNKVIEKAERRCSALGCDVIVFHDERDGLSLCPVRCADTMYIPLYVLHIARYRTVKALRAASKGRQRKKSLVLSVLGDGKDGDQRQR
jgi:hypothetical protein